MKVELSQNAILDLLEFKAGNQKLVIKYLEIFQDISKNPFTGIGKPEVLKHDCKGYWSRRVFAGHRIIYKIEEDKILELSCKGHYEK